MQQSDIAGGSVTWDDVLDDEQTWIISNCPDLYIIEQASDELQRKIRSIDMNRTLIQEIIRNYNVANALTPIPDRGQDARRIIYSSGDFTHSGDVGSNLRFGLEDLNYTMNLNKLTTKIHEALVDDPVNNRINYNKCFVCMLSLGFGQERGGHFGAVVGELNIVRGVVNIQCAVVDPYGIYAPAFRYLFEQAFEQLRNYVYDPLTRTYDRVTGATGSAFFSYTVTWTHNIVTTYLESISRTNSGTIPTTPLDEYGVQSYWGQDHFCFMWCIMFIHRFLITGTIASMDQLYNEIDTNSNINLVIIKAYIIQLLQLLDIRMSTFFNAYFKNIWTCYTVKVPGGPGLPPTNQTLYQPPIPLQFLTYEINYVETGRFLFDGTVASLGITGLIPVTLPSITNYDGMSCTNERADKRAILAKRVIPDELIIQHNIIETNSIYRILYFYINNLGAFVNSDAIYTRFTDQTTGAINMPACPSDEADDTINYMNLSTSMKAFEGNKCVKLTHAINNRNQLYMEQNMSMSCDITGGPTRRLHPYQQKAVDVMIRKASTNAPSGLLVWFGTGRGKTITANVAAKITTVCNQTYRRCFIISTKSVYKQFAYSLGNDTDITPDALLPNPTDPNQTENAAYYARHTMNGTFFPNIANFRPETDLYVFSSTRFQAILMDMETGDVKADWIPHLNDSLIIIDEAHKIINIDGKMEGEYRFFNSCCRAARQVMLMTATPMVNSPYDLEMLMALVDRRVPDPRAQFRDQYVGITEITANNPADICPIDGISDVNFNLPIRYTTRATANPLPKFDDRIIYAMSTGKLPANVERKLCILTTDQNQIQTLLPRPTMEVPNSNTSIPRSFGSNETKTQLYVNTKTEYLLKIIQARENTDLRHVIDTGSLATATPTLAPLQGIKFKYVIYSQSTTFLDKLKTELSSELISIGVSPAIIGTITGKTEDRKEVTKQYNSGAVRILLITDAAMEGVDLRRTAMVILAEPVWTKSKYDQIIGRGVRDSSGERLKKSDYDDIVKRIDENWKTIVEPLDAERQTVNAKIAQLLLASASRRTSPRGMTALQTELSDIDARILQSIADKTAIITYVDAFRGGILYPISTLPPNPYSDILIEELDFCRIPATVDCMTLILSYSTVVQGREKYSIDTYKYNAMRVKNSEINIFTNTMLRPLFITYP
jgi:superfamily II DNA or RNA helicase